MSDMLQTSENVLKNAPKVISLREWGATRGLSKGGKTDPFSGPLSSKMWRKVNNLKSELPDQFDWSIYDGLHERFGEKQPRGGIIFKTHLKLVNHHSTCTKCHYAFEIDTYGRGCMHNCVYCYAKESLTQHGYWNQPFPFPIDLSEIRKVFHTVFETEKRSKWRAILEKKVPLRIGSMSDSFMHMDKKYGVTRELLRILNFYEYPYLIFTRSDLVAEEAYLKLIDKRLAAVQFSISGTNEKITRALEPGAPSIARRFKALRNLADAGVWTTVRINPLFPTYPDGYFTDQRSVEQRFGSLDKAPRFDLLDITNTSELTQQLTEAKVPSVLAGFLRLSRYAHTPIRAATGVDIRSFFRDDIPQDLRDKRYTDSEIAYYYKILQGTLAKHGIRFNTCYIGNGIKDYFQYQKLWSNKSDCCDARGQVPAFASSSQDVPWTERLKHTMRPDDAKNAMMMDLTAEENLRPSNTQPLATKVFNDTRPSL